MSSKTIEAASLYFSEGSSDKEYHCAIVNVGEGLYEVTFRYGRRGSALTCGKKTTSPVSYDQAAKVYSKLVKEKTGKGYTPDVSGGAYVMTENAGNVSGITPMLLNPVSEDEAVMLLRDAGIVVQEKIDGERRMIRRNGDKVEGINRKGLVVALPALLVEAALSLGDDAYVIDGEVIGDQFFAFDLLELGGESKRHLGFGVRHGLLSALVEVEAHPYEKGIMCLPAHSGSEAKKNIFNKVKASSGEGVVFKVKDAPYSAGRPNSGGNQLKYKFVTDATVEISGINDGKRSVTMRVYDEDGSAVEIGSVTIPVNHSIPQVGSICDVTYLYYFENGSLFQPVYKGERKDLDVSDCSLSQLKLKAEAALAA